MKSICLALVLLAFPSALASHPAPEEIPAPILQAMQAQRYICGWRVLYGYILIPIYCEGSSGPVYSPPNPKP
ncbi:MAG: hypothetical protein JSR82_23395 [Verrucomicrobia bacterium]|nr:hypothetical protein [Verrucomicrobiota bacterium]